MSQQEFADDGKKPVQVNDIQLGQFDPNINKPPMDQ